MVVGNGPVVCPRDPTWLRRMLEVLPPGLRGKLEPFEGCPTSSGLAQHNPGSGQERRGRSVIRPVIRS